MNPKRYDVVVVGSGAGGGTVAQRLADMAEAGKKVLVLEQGPRFRDQDFTGREMEMAEAVFVDGGGFLTADGTMTLAFGQGYNNLSIIKYFKVLCYFARLYSITLQCFAVYFD